MSLLSSTQYPCMLHHRRSRIFVEPFIEDITVFTDDNDDGDVVDILQALSDFSYQASSGQFLVCCLQGSVTGQHVVLINAVVMSRNRRLILVPWTCHPSSTIMNAINIAKITGRDQRK